MAAKAQLSVETEVRLGYDINPFLIAGTDLASPYARVSVNPQVKKADGQGQITLGGHYDRTEYFKRYGGTDEYGGELAAQRRVTPKLAVYGSLSYDSEVIGLGDDDVTGQPADAIDVNLIGLRRRAETYRASGGLEYQVSSKDSITANGGYTVTRYGGGPAGSDTDSYGGSLGWKHAISSRTKIGVRGSVYRIDYDTPGLSTLIMQPTVTFSTQFSAAWKLDLSLGMSFSDLSVPFAGGDSKQTGFAANAQLCHTGAKDYFCLFGDRSVNASGIGDTVERTQIGVNYRRSLSERVGFTWNGSYARSASQSNIVGTRQYVSGRAGLDWKVSPVVTLGASGKYRDVYGQGVPIKADIGGDVYATVRLPGR
jgi:hypothetical protein